MQREHFPERQGADLRDQAGRGPGRLAKTDSSILDEMLTCMTYIIVRVLSRYALSIMAALHVAHR